MSTTPSTTPPSTGGLTPCQVIENDINKKNNQFKIMQGRLEVLLNDANSDLSDIQTARNELANINKELSRLKDEQRKKGCPSSTTTTGISLDNQTIISTSSVRRKDAAALTPVPMPTTSATPTTPTTP